MLLAGGISAWQRQQAIRTLAAYGDLVLVPEVPLLSDMARKRGSIAEQERSFCSAGTLVHRDQRVLIGQIDSSESIVTQQMRRQLRVQGKALEHGTSLRRLG